MRLPRFRFTVRRMMIAVALLAVSIEGGIVLVRYVTYRDRAAMLRRHAATLRRTVARFPGKPRIPGLVLGYNDGRPDVRATPENTLDGADFLEMLARKYERVARHPWLPVAPDPPEP